MEAYRFSDEIGFAVGVIRLPDIRSDTCRSPFQLVYKRGMSLYAVAQVQNAHSKIHGQL